MELLSNISETAPTSIIRDSSDVAKHYIYTHRACSCSPAQMNVADSIFLGNKYSMQPYHSSHQSLMMETEAVSKALDTNYIFTRLISQEHFNDNINKSVKNY
jgi:hypothetical protein